MFKLLITVNSGNVPEVSPTSGDDRAIFGPSFSGWFCMWRILLFDTKYLSVYSFSPEFFTVSKWDICFRKDLLNDLFTTVSRERNS